MLEYRKPAFPLFRSRLPFLGLLGAAGSGVLVSDSWPDAWAGWGTLFLIGAICHLFLGRTASTLATIFLFFGFWHSYRIWDDEGYQIANQLTGTPHLRMVTALVVSAPTKFRWGSSTKQRFLAKVTKIDERLSSFLVSMEVAEQSIRYGDLIQVCSRLDRPAPPLNPGEFDYATYLRRKQVYLVLRSLNRSEVTIVGRGRGNVLIAFVIRARQAIENVLIRGLEDDTEIGQIIQGIVVGTRTEMSPDLLDLLQRTGTLHLFVVDGLKVTFFAGITWAFIRVLKLKRRWAALAVLPVIIGYCILTGFSSSSLRATLMACLVFAGISIERPTILINTLAASGFLLLLTDSQQLFQVGFQLSFVVVFAIVIFVRPLSHLLFRPFETDPFLPHQLVDRRQRSAQQVVRWVCDLTSVSTVCWFASLPILILAFHRVSICGLVANVVAVPLGTWILLLGVMSLLISPVSSWASICINNANWLLTKVFLWGIQVFALLPYNSVNVAFPPIQSSFMITALSVGRGSVFHLHSTSDDWLINTGTESKWRHVTEPYLQANGVNQLGTIILTHDDLTRGGGMAEAARRFGCRRLLIADNYQALANTPALQAVGLQEWPSDGLLSSTSGIVVSELGPTAGARRSNGRKIPAFLCRLKNWRILIAPDLTLETLQSLPLPSVDVAFVSRIDRNSVARLGTKLTLQAIVCERGAGDTMGSKTDSSQVPTFCLPIDGATMLSVRGDKLELRTFRGAQLTLTKRSR